MHIADDPPVRRQPGSRGPLVVAVLSSLAATIVVVGWAFVVTVASSCSFMAGRCDGTEAEYSPLSGLIAVVAVAVTWVATVRVVVARNAQQPRWPLYVSAVGIPASVTAVAIWLISVTIAR